MEEHQMITGEDKKSLQDFQSAKSFFFRDVTQLLQNTMTAEFVYNPS